MDHEPTFTIATYSLNMTLMSGPAQRDWHQFSFDHGYPGTSQPNNTITQQYTHDQTGSTNTDVLDTYAILAQ